MNLTTRLLAFGVALLALLGVSFGVGQAVGPEPTPGSATAEDTHGTNGDEMSDMTKEAAVLGGLASAEDGYRLVLDDAALTAGPDQPVSFRILGADETPLLGYEVEHEKELHFIAVRRDLTGFQHVHPERGADGAWTTALDLTPGAWRVFADFVPQDGPAAGITLGADLAVPGAYDPQPLPAPATTVDGDGMTVMMRGQATTDTTSTLSFDITGPDGTAVTPDPYLGARGHLVALRDGDLAYIHVHADADTLSFEATFPTSGTYALFLDVSVDGTVRTAPFTLEVTP